MPESSKYYYGFFDVYYFFSFLKTSQKKISVNNLHEFYITINGWKEVGLQDKSF
jgi:hypothetical protein